MALSHPRCYVTAVHTTPRYIASIGRAADGFGYYETPEGPDDVYEGDYCVARATRHYPRHDIYDVYRFRAPHGAIGCYSFTAHDGEENITGVAEGDYCRVSAAPPTRHARDMRSVLWHAWFEDGRIVRAVDRQPAAWIMRGTRVARRATVRKHHIARRASLWHLGERG